MAMFDEIDSFTKYLRRKNPASTTHVHYASDLQIFFSYVDVAPWKVTPADVDRFIDWQLSLGHAKATINRRLASLRSFYFFLIDRSGLQLPNPVLPRRHFLKRGRHLPRDAKDDTVARLFAVINHPRDQAIFTLMLRCGLRVGEVQCLRLQDL